MKKIIVLVVLVCALALATLAACGGPSSSGGGGSSGSGAQTNPSVSMPGASFEVTSMTITKGSTITFVDPSSGGAPHILVNGSSGLSAPEQGAPTFPSGGESVAPGHSWTSPPWNTAGTFHVTCTIHPTTMTLTVIVTG